MKKYLSYIVIFLIGAFAGMWAHRQYHFRGVTKMYQNDTIVRFDTIRYSRLELTTNSCRLMIPKISSPELVYIPTHSLDTIYRDNIQYVTLPRQFFHTKTQDAEIWHSGIDSRVDSLNVFRRNTVVTKTETAIPKGRKHSISLYGGIGYLNAVRIPVGLEYQYHIWKWLAVGAKVEHDFAIDQTGIYGAAEITIGW